MTGLSATPNALLSRPGDCVIEVFANLAFPVPPPAISSLSCDSRCSFNQLVGVLALKTIEVKAVEVFLYLEGLWDLCVLVGGDDIGMRQL